jgi:putative glutamine amidotransferase
MQTLNVVCGGNLFYHIPIDIPDAICHFDPNDVLYRHGVLISHDSHIGRACGDGEILVNSRHHMAIDKVAKYFRVSARSQDGIVEAIESIDPDWFAIGTQFHPETEPANSSVLRIFKTFIDYAVIHSKRFDYRRMIADASSLEKLGDHSLPDNVF